MTGDEGNNAVASDNRGRRLRVVGSWALGATGVLAMALGGVWIARAPLAENLIARELAARGVTASYDIAAIGLRTQRIENLVLGDPRHPDLTARWVEVDIALAGITPRVAAVRAQDVYVRGIYHAGKLSLGQIDKFLASGTSSAAQLPDLRLGIGNARVSLATDFGPVGLAIDGNGNLRDGFSGRAVGSMPVMRFGPCAGQAARAALAIKISDGAPLFRGPLTARNFACPAKAVAASNVRLDVDGSLDKAFAAWTGRSALSADALRLGDETLGRVAGSVEGHGASDGSAQGSFTVASKTLSGPSAALADAAVQGDFNITRNHPDSPMQVALRGRFNGSDLAPPARAQWTRNLRGVGAETPVGPLVDRFVSALEGAARRNNFSGGFDLVSNGGNGSLQLRGLHFASHSGARIDLLQASIVEIGLSDGGLHLDGTVSMAGGGLPDGKLSLATRDGGALAGRLDLVPYAAGSARLALAPVRFLARQRGVSSFSTSVSLDGPIGDGAVRGLSMAFSGAINGRGGFAINAGCAPLSWQSLKVASLRLAAARVALCPTNGAMLSGGRGGIDGGVAARALALRGVLGSAPFELNADGLAYMLGSGRIGARNIETRIGAADAPVRLAAQTLDAAFGNGGVSGSFSGGRGRIGTVPLDLSQMAGPWHFTNGTLDLDGTMRVADTAPDARFNPVAVPDAHLHLSDGRITADGHVRHPVRGSDIARIEIVHDLASGGGNARFVVDGLNFGAGLQPDDLTPLALGVIANVQGKVAGKGQIRWTGDAVTSDGSFETEGMNLAAAFGPVDGLSGRIDFTDLLGLVTAPHQRAKLSSVNPGIEVRDGHVDYQLIGNQQVRVEGGEWPFSGGKLILLPTTLDFDAKHPRNLAFRVEGLDAGAFINTMELKNVSGTGTFDGVFPMVFDQNGGRIVGGILIARQDGDAARIVTNAHGLVAPCDPTRQGGTLSYVGDVSNAEMNMFGKLAFDALKHLRYKCLTILLDGAIDGEFVTQVAVNGVNQGSDEASKSALIRPFLGLPFIFNVRIEAPFRGLLSTYQSFADPSTLIRNSLGAQYQSVLRQGTSVQPADSDK